VKAPGAVQAFTVDVEEYFQVEAFGGVVSREDWTRLPSRVEGALDDLLGLMHAHDVRGTFFTLGWIADRHPAIPKMIVTAGHEIASHGWTHRRVVTLSREQFRREVRESRAVLEDLTGTRVRGYRAPSFSILPSVDWAYDVLIEEGYLYDSSVFPIRRRNYGNPHANPGAHVIEGAAGRLLELPMATTRFGPGRFPGAGGAYLRLLPFWITRRTAREYAARGESGIFYIHPWEIDPGQPRLDVSRLAKLRHYTNLGRMRPRLERLFRQFRFERIEECYREELAALAVATSDATVAPVGSADGT